MISIIALLALIHVSLGSYLNLPRITFTGRAIVDVSTVNNVICNFGNDDIDNSWNPNGTGEFIFLDSSVMSAISSVGSSAADSALDMKVVNNLNLPYPKIVDIDPEHQFSSVIYGLELALQLADGSIALKGWLKPFPLVQDMWQSIICGTNGGMPTFSSKAGTIITDITWGNIDGSPVLQELRRISSDKLSFSLTIFRFNPSPSNVVNFTTAHVVGAIGAVHEDESVHFAGERLLSKAEVDPFNLPRIDGGENQDCLLKKKKWLNDGMTSIDHTTKTLSADLSNSFSFDGFGDLLNVGSLWLGLQVSSGDGSCIRTIGDPIPYLHSTWRSVGSIVDRVLSDEEYGLVVSNRLVAVRKALANQEATVLFAHSPAAQAASSSRSYSCTNAEELYDILLLEPTTFVRPLGDYLMYLEYQEQRGVSFEVTRYGIAVPNTGVQVTLQNTTDCIMDLPKGVVPDTDNAKTDSSGIATITFTVVDKLAAPRKCNCSNSWTDIPIDGRMYLFNFKTSDGFVNPNPIAIRAFSYFNEPEEPNWNDHVSPIFTLYERLYPVMKKILSLGSHTQVTQNHNLHMLEFSMSVNINHPTFMPVTRDLSPPKTRMILKWLKRQKKRSVLPSLRNSDFTWPSSRCSMCNAEEEPREYAHLYMENIKGFRKHRQRPLFRLGIKNKLKNLLKKVAELRRAKNGIDASQYAALKEAGQGCTLDGLKEQLQIAVQLEWATMPVYLTAMFSIKPGANKEAYQRIRSVVIQEMQHMTQAANILIAVGGRPVIDSSNYTPHYPGKLPGDVLPNLEVTIEPLSKEYVQNVMMGIEVPHNISLDHDNEEIFNNTIGQFYEEIITCIEYLAETEQESIFVPESVDKQVTWPWEAPTVGTVSIVTNTESAVVAINNIVKQGEGASPIDPTMGASAVDPPFKAHFYNFEEITCEKRLVYNPDKNRYCYNGPDVPFDSNGVWPTKVNENGVVKPKPNTNCYTAAKVLHGAYRAMLKRLQEVFDGKPQIIKEAIAIMYSLTIHGKKVLSTKLEPGSDFTCGPVWDYEWDE